MRYRAAPLTVLLLCLVPNVWSDQIVFVPWKVDEPGAVSTSAALVLYWIPSSPEELRHSEMITSRALAVYASRCVGMHVVRADDGERIEKFGATGRLPVALLMDGERELARVPNESGLLHAKQVETMVRGAFDSREITAIRQLAEAKRLAADGQPQAAIDAYQSVSAQRCAFPRLAKEADRALRKLGIR